MIDLPINLGPAGAFQTGMKYALEGGYDYAVQFDGDGQHNAEYSGQMVKLAQENNLDIVIVSRFVTVFICKTNQCLAILMNYGPEADMVAYIYDKPYI